MCSFLIRDPVWVLEQHEIIEELDKRVSNLEVLERQVEELKVLISQGTEK